MRAAALAASDNAAWIVLAQAPGCPSLLGEALLTVIPGCVGLA